VGVVADMRRQGPEREPVPQMFESMAQSPPRSVDIVVRTSSPDPLMLAAALRTAVRRWRRMHRSMAVAPLEQQLGTYLAQRRFETSLLSGFSVVALLMAAVGIYGLMQFSIATRTREIGLRMAIGAQAGDIFRMIIGEGLALSLTGVALGLLGAWWLARAGSSLVLWRDYQRSVDLHSSLAPAHRRCNGRLRFPGATRNESRSRRGIAYDLIRNGVRTEDGSIQNRSVGPRFWGKMGRLAQEECL
jgi:hypothetical protein